MPADINELVRLSKTGDEKAIARLITLYKQLIFTLAYRMIQDYELSRDICQETFIKAFKNIHKLKNPASMKAWLCSIARNIIYDKIRERKKHNTVSLEQIQEPLVSDQSLRIRKQMIIQNALARLNEQDRLLLSLYYYQGMDIKDVAVITKRKPENIKMALSRARARLRRELKGYEDELMP